MNRQWLLETADVPICYNLTKDIECGKSLLQNGEVSDWFCRLAERSVTEDIGEIHGSHNYRMENILGKCWILGLEKNIQPFSEKMKFIISFLNQHVETALSDALSFGKLYHYRDYEKVLCCFLPLLGFQDDPAVLHILRKRIDVLYGFTRQKRYDIYIDGSKLRGVKKEWQPYIINPQLYADGHISLPDMHDFILFAGMYAHLSAEEQGKIETITKWLFDERYNGIMRRYGYFYIPGDGYNAKAIVQKLQLLDFENMSLDKGNLVSLVFTVFILSHFKAARESRWFLLALQYLEQYKIENGHFHFPSYLITEKSDCYVISGGHMNVGENKKSKLYNEIVSTYWMERIYHNML